jgi:pyruvate formate lyase activating enzyme
MGFVHSWEVGSTVDGPGVRMTIWTTGCEMRCMYCHNPDTWKRHNGQPTDVDELLTEIRGYAPFLKTAHGGVTISGGEPLVQAAFVMRLLRGCRAMGLHTALDTNGAMGGRLSDNDLAAIDLVLLDIKSWNPDTHRRVTGVDVAPVLRFARRLSDRGVPAWVRFVLVPGLTDAAENIAGLAQFVSTLRNVERVEILPFHQMGRAKWYELGLRYDLAQTPPADEDAVERVRAVFRERGLPVR